MKKLRCMLCLAVLAGFMFSGCKPIYQKLVQGDWKVDTYKLNGQDETSTFLVTHNNYQITFHSDGDFTEEYDFILHVAIPGTWEIDKKPDGEPGEFQLQLVDENNVRNFDIKKISKESIHLYRDLSEDEYEEFFLEPVPAS